MESSNNAQWALHDVYAKAGEQFTIPQDIPSELKKIYQEEKNKKYFSLFRDKTLEKAEEKLTKKMDNAVAVIDTIIMNIATKLITQLPVPIQLANIFSTMAQRSISYLEATKLYLQDNDKKKGYKDTNTTPAIISSLEGNKLRYYMTIKLIELIEKMHETEMLNNAKILYPKDDAKVRKEAIVLFAARDIHAEHMKLVDTVKTQGIVDLLCKVYQESQKKK